MRLFAAIACSLLPLAAQTPADRSVVVIGYDGLSARGLSMAKAPHIAALRAAGASTMHARAVLPTVSSPNWASMIMGAIPSQHGVTSNDWQPDAFTIAPACRGIAALFPTIFGVLRDQQPAVHIAIFHEWDGFARLVEPATPDWMEHGKDAADTVSRAVAYLGTHRPAPLFIHLDRVDDALHHKGHLTPPYMQAITEVDGLTGRVLDALDRNGMRGQTVILLTADHGGAGKKHGGESMGELEIPWIISGAGIRQGVELQTPVNTFDTAATIAHILGLTPPPCWIGSVLAEAFE